MIVEKVYYNELCRLHLESANILILSEFLGCHYQFLFSGFILYLIVLLGKTKINTQEEDLQDRARKLSCYNREEALNRARRKYLQWMKGQHPSIII